MSPTSNTGSRVTEGGLIICRHCRDTNSASGRVQGTHGDVHDKAVSEVCRLGLQWDPMARQSWLVHTNRMRRPISQSLGHKTVTCLVVAVVLVLKSPTDPPTTPPSVSSPLPAARVHSHAHGLVARLVTGIGCLKLSQTALGLLALKSKTASLMQACLLQPALREGVNGAIKEAPRKIEGNRGNGWAIGGIGGESGIEGNRGREGGI